MDRYCEECRVEVLPKCYKPEWSFCRKCEDNFIEDVLKNTDVEEKHQLLAIVTAEMIGRNLDF